MAPRRFPWLRLLIGWLVTAGALLVLGDVLAGFNVSGVAAALGGALIIGFVNALVWPLVIRIALPLTVLTLGLGVLVLNGLAIMVLGVFDWDGIEVRDLGTGIAVAFGLALVTTIVGSLLAIDDDDFFTRNVIQRGLRRRAGAVDADVPGLFFLEIDGLAHDVLRRGMRDGTAPNLARLVREGSHRLVPWETDWSSQTGACQAGLLHGSNHDMPAFRWWEKDRGRAIVTNHPKDAAELERRVSDGRGLLHADGASRANILSGDAPHSLLTMSTVLQRGRGRLGQDYYAYFANPYAVTRTAIFTVREIVSEWWSATRQRRRDIQPRVHRGATYGVMRAWATVIQLDLQVASVIGDLALGRPVGYTTFLAYDEVAHHSGVERPETLQTLLRVDQAIGRIMRAAEGAPRAYEFVVLADHGQSQGATFLQRYGETLEQLVERACGTDALALLEDGDTSRSFFDASVTEAAEAPRAVGRLLARATKGKTAGDTVLLGREHRERVEEARGEDGGEAPPEVVAMASGCLGLVSFPRMPGRVTLEQLEQRYPRLLPALVAHEGIGFVLVRSAARGAVVLGARGSHDLATGIVEGEDPLAPFGPNAARHVKRTDGFATCPDLALNSTYWADRDEVAAFEELVGSHGGMGGGQSHPFVLAPADFVMPDAPLVGAEHVHRLMRRWLADLGHAAYS